MVRGDVDAATYFHDSAVSLFARINPQAPSVLRYTDAGVNLYDNAILASQALLIQQSQVVEMFGLQSRPSADALFDRSHLPTAASRKVSA